MKSFIHKGDFWSGLALAALGAYIVSESAGWVYMGEDGPGAGFFPIWYGGLMIVLSLLLVAGSVFKAGVATDKKMNWNEVVRALGCWVVFAVTIGLMEYVGFIIAFALLTWFIVAVMFKQKQWVALAIAIGGSVGTFLLFTQALELQLPTGPWF